MTYPAHESSADDFDFIIGSWQVKHCRLKERLVGCKEWVEFDGDSSTRKVLGGFGNLEDNYLALAEGAYRAVALRSFNDATKQWSIWWLDGRQPGQIDTPVVGQFANGKGIFYAEDRLHGQPIQIRFIWSVPEPDRPRWEQAFSGEAGQTWETNWTMNFTRLAP